MLQAREEQILKDKEVIDNIIAKINEEDRLEMEKRNSIKEDTRSLVKQFQEERTRTKEVLRQQEIQEEAKIKEYNDMIHLRAMQEEAHKRALESKREDTWTKVVEETNLQTRSREEYEELRDMLWQETFEANKAKAEKDRLIQRLILKEETMRLNQAQIAAKKEMIAKMEEEERLLVQLMLEKFAADDEEERKKQQQRQAENEKFLTEIQLNREEKLKLFELERQRELSERTAGAEQEEYRRFVVAEARKRLLQQHAKQLQGFLSKVRFCYT